VALGVLAGGLLMGLWEGQLPELTAGPTRALGSLLPALSRNAAYPLLYIEESGVPLPLPGDVIVMYMGHQLASAPVSAWVPVWAGMVTAQVLGAINLFLLSRRLGRDFPNTRLGRFLHVDERRMQRAEAWFQKWGPWVLVFGRHVPGLRIVLTVAAGVSRLGLVPFVASVAVSSAAWVAFFLFLGARFGGTVGHLLDLHRGNYVLLPVLLALAVATYAWYRRQRLGAARV
jgi:membrane protein DedA with SNARE-associated domain